jgi:hypothetical protein
VPPLAFSPLDVLLGVGLAVAGFIVVALVCAAVLAMLHLVLPSTDSEAEAIDRLNPPVEDARPAEQPAQVDSETNA